jgi:putative transposase
MLAGTVRTHKWRCLAYCLMTNHYHLVVGTPVANISAGMHRLNGEYARWFNRRHGHFGHLFEDRFHSGVIETDGYLLEACRYVLLNPVRAGIVRTPAEWSWSSYGATLTRSQPHVVAVDALLGLFGAGDAETAARRFKEFVDDGLPGHGQVPGTRAWPG